MSESERLRLAVIIGSTRSGRFGPTVAGWFAAKARRRADLEVDLIDLAEAGLPQNLTDQDEPVPPQVRALAPRLTAADAFAVVTPEYNRSFPAPLKTAIDWYYEEWQAKPVTFVAYGRESGGLHAIGQLREIFTELNAVAIRDAICLPRYWDLFAADGSWPKPTADCNAAAATALDRLSWWAHALRDARARRPYGT
ncbi:NADPH-dependent FMN reductase [Actinomadura sp. HBU206391]|uniref:NADPH-dependent FMN reductase n=1 Tax=Actinomadura sp. HBU206391 TaxID=2731692 RepID=UPI00164FF493|nr:NAD(P)H-dependent oxidoreductase [Actinomadura sp. HBU206391]MBC6462233.1 NAD(P)H-dependent oxidoreductase [Actinomadura sp. HBU206391]